MDIAVDQCIEREIASLANSLAGVESIAHLANENIAALNLFAPETLHTAVLGFGVTSVSAGALSFFMCHTSPGNNHGTISVPKES
jgi:hypothetical protein